MPAQTRRGSSRRSSGGRASGEKQYRGIVGFIAFPVDDDETPEGDPVRRMKVQDGSILYAVTVWPSHEDIELNEGDLVAIQGSYNKNETDDNTYHNISASKLVVLGQDEGTRDDKPKSGGRGRSGAKGKPAAKGRARKPAAEPDDDDDDGDDDDF